MAPSLSTWLAFSMVLAFGCDGCSEPRRDATDEAPRDPAQADQAEQAEPPLVESTPADLPAADGAFAPSLARVGDDLWASWLEPTGDGHRVRVARLGARGWDAPVTAVSSAEMFANWADFPGLAPLGDGSMLLHWRQKSGEGTYAYDVSLLRSDDQGRAWRPLAPPHGDGTETEHGFVSVAGTDPVRLFWLDGRETGGEDEGGEDESDRGAMTLRTATVAGAIGEGALLDGRVCDCCQTAAVETSSGPVVFYRDRSEDEVRDIAYVRRVGDAWSEPTPLHRDGWVFRGCPVNGPAAAADGARVAAAWTTGGGERAGTWLAFSKDAGAAFSEPVRVDGPETLGRVDVALLEGGAVVSYLSPGSPEGQARVMLRRVEAGGRRGDAAVVAHTSAARVSGFPRLATLGDQLVVAWVEADDAPRRLRAARLSPSALAVD